MENMDSIFNHLHLHDYFTTTKWIIGTSISEKYSMTPCGNPS